MVYGTPLSGALTSYFPLSSSTSRDEADGAEEPTLCVVHLQWQQLASERENLIRQRPESSVVDLSAGQGQAVGESHGVLVRSVASANPQDLDGRRREPYGGGWKREGFDTFVCVY